MHGGWISIMNQAIGLLMRGASVNVAVSAWAIPTFESNFPQIRDAGILLPYRDRVRNPNSLAAELYEIAGRFDVIVGTLFTTIQCVSFLASCHPHVRPAYFIQDCESTS